MKKEQEKSISEKVVEMLKYCNSEGTLKKKVNISYIMLQNLINNFDNVDNWEKSDAKKATLELFIQIMNLIDEKVEIKTKIGGKKEISKNTHYQWKKKIHEIWYMGVDKSNFKTTNRSKLINELKVIKRPFSPDDFEFRKDNIFSKEEQDFLSKIGCKNFSTFDKLIKLKDTKKMVTSLTLLIFLTAVFDLKISKDYGRVSFSGNCDEYYGFYDRSFELPNDFGICDLTIFNNYWAFITYYYKTDSDFEELSVLGKLESYGKNGITILKNFEDFGEELKTISKKNLYKLGPVENFIVLKTGSGEIPEQKLVLGYCSSFNRLKNYPYTTSIVLISKPHASLPFNREIIDIKKNWENLKSNRDPETIAPLYNYIYHQSLSLANLQTTENENFYQNPIKQLSDIPFYGEFELLTNVKGYYKGLNLLYYNKIPLAVITKMEIFSNGMVKMTIPYIDKKNVDDVDFKTGFIKNIIDNDGISYDLVIEMRHNYQRRYHEMIINLKFIKTENDEKRCLYGTFSNKGFYTKNPFSARIIFEEVNKEEFDVLTSSKERLVQYISKLQTNTNLVNFYMDTEYEILSDNVAINSLRSLLNNGFTTLEGNYWIFVNIKNSQKGGELVDKIPYLSIMSLHINSTGEIELLYGINMKLKGFLESKKSKSVLILRNSDDLFIITFNSNSKFDSCYGVLTRFSDNGQPESYLIYLVNKASKKISGEKINNGILKFFDSDRILYSDLITEEPQKTKINPKIESIDKVLGGNIKFLLGTEALRMVRASANVDNDANHNLKFNEYRRIYFQSAIFNLNDDTFNEKQRFKEAKIALVKAFQQGFSSLFFKGEKVGVSFKERIPEELKEDYKLFLQYENKLIENSDIHKLIKTLWGEHIFEEIRKIV